MDALEGSQPGPAVGGKRPNVLVICTDQHRADHVGFGGNEVVRTPHLDRLADRGVVFDKAYVANPICMPNRATIFTGRMPSAHGTRVNGISLDPDANTFVRALRSNGYVTRLIGKAHLQAYGSRPEAAAALQDDEGVEGESLTSRGPAGWDSFERTQLHEDGHVEAPSDFYGFGSADLVVGHSDTATGHYRDWLRSRRPDADRLRGRQSALASHPTWEQIYQTAIPEELYPTTYVVERAVGAIEELAGGDAPFFLFVSFPDPHHPFTPPGRYWDMYSPNAVSIPRSFDEPHRGLPPHVQEMLSRRGRQESPFLAFAPTEDQLRHAMAAQYGMITMIDDAVGRIMETLASAGAFDDTIVIFTSDHGDMFGDHGLLLKHGLHYEACVRVPLVISVPGMRPDRSGSLAGSIDIAPTVLDLVGLPRYAGMQGCSLRPLLDRSSPTARESVLIEEEQIFSLPGLDGPVLMRTVVSPSGRLTLYGDGSAGELYDHLDDPRELQNLYRSREKSALQREMEEELLRSLIAHADRGIVARAMA